MKTLALAALALMSGLSIACAEDLTVTQIHDIKTLPCSIFLEGGWDSLKEGVVLSIPISATNNSELFTNLSERMGDCRDAKSIVSPVARR